MIETAEVAMWDARCNDLQNSLERLREERDELKQQNEQAIKDLNITIQASIELNQELEACRERIRSLGGQLDRLRLHLQQGIEL